jgi:ankyrin repeat protein
MSQGCGRSRSAALPAIAPDCDRGVDIKPGYSKTCRWLLESRAYLDWLNPDKLPEHHGFFWIKGKPGCGKSTLTKFAFMEIKKSLQDATLLSFFFNARGTYLEKSTVGLYRSLLVQLLATFPDDQLWSIPSLIHRHLNENVKANREILKQLLVQVMQRLEQHNITVIIDAHDECDEDEVRDMIALFEELGEDAVSNGRTFRVLFSSRHYPHITIQQSVQIRLEDQHGHIQDIEKYLLSELRAGRGKHVKQIREEIRDRASGVFIWVVLVVKILNKAIDHGHVHALREKLQEIPDDLNELFRRILMWDRQNMDEMKLCIQWILYSNRPLKPEELYFAMLSGLEPEEPLRPWDPDEISTEDINLFILSSSKGLAEITKTKAGTVQFIHESVRDFLLKENGLGQIWADLEVNASGLTHNRLKECCFNYTRSEPSSRMEVPKVLSPASTSKARELRKKVSLKFPFLEYAIYNMLMHADISQAKGIDQEGFIKELEIRNWVQLNNTIETYQVRRLPADIDLLYILAEQNCPDLIDLVMRNSPCQRNQNGRYGNPIFAAIVKDSRQAFEALTKIDRQMQNYSCEFPYPNKEISSFLVKHGKPELIYRFLSVYRVDITSTLETGETMLSWASLRGHEQIVKLLLDKGADINAQGGPYSNALQAASEGGYEQVVKLLLDKGADVNAQGGPHSSALQAASVGGHEQIVKLLLNKGADVNAQGGYHGNALQAALAGGHEQIVKLLLNKGADVNAQGGNYGSALKAASVGGHKQIVKLLLDKGANVNAQGGPYSNAL